MGRGQVMETRFLKFKSSAQPAVKLAIAAEDFFRPELPEEYRQVYGRYLQQRIRPAVELLILEDDADRLEELARYGWFPEAGIDDFLQKAAREHKNSAYVWLLKRKQETRGFAPRDFSL